MDNQHIIAKSIGLVRAGNVVEVTYVRNNQSLQVTLKLIGFNSHSYADLHPQLAGARFRNLEPSDLYYDSIDAVLIDTTTRDSQAWQNGLRGGDLIVSINRYRVHNLDQVEQLFSRFSAPFVLNILRNDKRLSITIH